MNSKIVLDLAVAGRNAWSTDNNWNSDLQPLNNGASSLIFAGNVRLAPAALNIANGATVTHGAIPPSPAPEFGDGGALLGAPALPVPEPGMVSMLTVGALWCARKRSPPPAADPPTRAAPDFKTKYVAISATLGLCVSRNNVSPCPMWWAA